MISPATSAPPAVPPAERPCVSCGAVFRGSYCPDCGERRLEAVPSLRHFVEESLAALTDVDSTLYRTARALVRRPGLLTAEYLAGRRTPYLRPVQLFVLCNLLFFFLQPLAGFNTLTTELAIHLHQLPYSPLVRPMVEGEIARRGVDPGRYSLLFDATSASHAKTLVFVMIPLFAGFVALAFARRRRTFVAHVVFATHFYAYFLLAVLAVSALVHLTVVAGRATGTLREWMGSDLLWTCVMAASWLVYLYPALRRVYGCGRAGATLRALFLAAGLLVVLQLYRLVLFFTAFHAV